MTSLYDAYLHAGHPALPPGYSFKIKNDVLMYFSEFSIVKRSRFGFRRRQLLSNNDLFLAVAVDFEDLPGGIEAWAVAAMARVHHMWDTRRESEHLREGWESIYGVYP